MAEGNSAITHPELLEVVSCPICLGVFENPVALPCFHSFCRECLIQYVNTSKPGSELVTAFQGKGKATTFRCPTCRAENSLPDGDLEKLPTNFFVNNLKDVLASLTAAADVCDIGLCDGDDAKWRCLDCSKSMCNTCKTAHDRMGHLTRGHAIVGIDEWKKSDITDICGRARETCEEHPSEELKFYCSVCRLPICRDCHILEHADHRCRGVSDVARESKQNMKTAITKLQSTKTDVESIRQVLLDQEGIILQSEKDVLEKIAHHKYRAIDIITKYYDKLEAQVKNERASSQKNLQLAIEHYDTESACLQSACELGENTIRFGRNSEAITTYGRLSQLADSKHRSYINAVKKQLKMTIHEFQPGKLDMLTRTEVLGDCRGRYVNIDSNNKVKEGSAQPVTNTKRDCNLLSCDKSCQGNAIHSWTRLMSESSANKPLVKEKRKAFEYRKNKNWCED